MPEQQILMKVQTCDACHLQGVRSPGHQYDVTIISKAGPLTGEDETIGDDLVILCEEHAGPVMQVTELLTKYRSADSEVEVIEIKSVEDLMQLQPQRELEPPAVETPAGPDGDVEPIDPPRTIDTVVRCLQCQGEMTYQGFGSHVRGSHPPATGPINAPWEFVNLPEGVEVIRCGEPIGGGETCQQKFTRLTDYENHCRVKRHLRRT